MRIDATELSRRESRQVRAHAGTAILTSRPVAWSSPSCAPEMRPVLVVVSRSCQRSLGISAMTTTTARATSVPSIVAATAPPPAGGSPRGSPSSGRDAGTTIRPREPPSISVTGSLRDTSAPGSGRRSRPATHTAGRRADPLDGSTGSCPAFSLSGRLDAVREITRHNDPELEAQDKSEKQTPVPRGPGDSSSSAMMSGHHQRPDRFTPPGCMRRLLRDPGVRQKRDEQ